MTKRLTFKMGWTVLACLMILLLTGFTQKPITSAVQLSEPGIRIAAMSDTPEYAALVKAYPEAEIVPYNSMMEAYSEVANGRVDAVIYARNEMEMAIENGVKGVRLLDENYATNQVVVALSPVSKMEDIQEKLNAFIEEMRLDGTLEDMYDRWVVRREDAIPEISEDKEAAFTLNVGTTGMVVPFTYYKGTELTGFDIELAKRFAAYLGAKLELKTYDFGGLVTAAETGAIDCIMSHLYYTPERAESLPLSDTLFESEIAVMVRAEEGVQEENEVQEENGKENGSSPSSIESFNGKRIGVQAGTEFDEMVGEVLPDAKLAYFITKADLVAALEGGKVDAFVVDEPVAQMLMHEQDNLTYLPDYLDFFETGAIFPKSEAGEDLREEFNAFLEPLLQDGTLDEMAKKWFGEDEEAKTMPDIASLPATNGTLVLATESGYAPFEYVRDGQVVGYDMELVALFCEANGYGLQILDMNFDGILPSVQSMKCNFAAAGISITPERAESVLFSNPTFRGGAVLVALKNGESTTQAKGWEAYNGKRIAVLTGPLMEDLAKEYFPDSEQLLFNSYPDCIAALLEGKVDGYLGDEVGVKSVHMEQPEIDYIRDRIAQNDNSFAFRKNDPESAALCQELNDFIDKSWEDGTIQEIDDIWFGTDEERKVVDMSDLTGENGTIKVVTTSTDMPFSYIKDGKNVGYDIDLVVRFCRERGYGLELGDVDFGGRIPAIESGKYDFTTDMNVTPEREEQVLFAHPTSYGGIVLAVRATDLMETSKEDSGVGAADEKTSYLDELYVSFEKTFLREGRWRLFVQGVGTTMLITLLSILLGTTLGFVVFLLCRNGNPLANLITRFCLWLVQGMPMVVLLMILYYIIFAKIAIHGIAVAVIGFTLTFGASVFGLLKMGVGAVDGGQYEAAYALGYSNRRTFFRIILPQALPHVMGAYKGEMVGLIKATAVVGYIAVQDLTKMGDIVRSRTYEAFFPLIAVTIIYFVLEGVIGLVLGRISKGLNPKHRKKTDILKGVETDD